MGQSILSIGRQCGPDRLFVGPCVTVCGPLHLAVHRGESLTGILYLRPGGWPPAEVIVDIEALLNARDRLEVPGSCRVPCRTSQTPKALTRDVTKRLARRESARNEFCGPQALETEHGRETVAPPGNQAENRANKLHPKPPRQCSTLPFVRNTPIVTLWMAREKPIPMAGRSQVRDQFWWI